MSSQSKWEYFKSIYARYRQACKVEKGRILSEFCRVCGFNRKYAIRKLSGPAPGDEPARRRGRKPRCVYGPGVVAVLSGVWEAADYPWSVRLKAVLPLWMPWTRKTFVVSDELARKLLKISSRQIDRLLHDKKHLLKRRLYGRTKPGTLLRSQVPIKTDHWDVKEPGFTEVDLVSHSGERADGEFAYTVNQTDILSSWVESQAVLGRGEAGVIGALDEMEEAFPFTVRGIDSDNGSEFINHHLIRRCRDKGIQLTRGRPYKKDDNAHIEQKNWTHVRKLMGWDRYDTRKAVDAMNDLYRHEHSWMMNLFQPSVKLVKKVRVGSRLKRVYDAPQTPLDRLLKTRQGDPKKIAALKRLRDRLNPFDLSRTLDAKLDRIYKLAHFRRPQPSPASTAIRSSLDRDHRREDDHVSQVRNTQDRYTPEARKKSPLPRPTTVTF